MKSSGHPEMFVRKDQSALPSRILPISFYLWHDVNQIYLFNKKRSDHPCASSHLDGHYANAMQNAVEEKRGGWRDGSVVRALAAFQRTQV